MILTDQDIYGMYSEPRSDEEMVAFAREVEQVVIAKLAQGVSMEPVVYRFTENRGNGRTSFSYHTPEEVGTAYRDNCLEVTRLYDSTTIAAVRLQEQQVNSSNMEPCKGIIKGLTAERDAARVQAIEACAKVCEALSATGAQCWREPRVDCADAIRALIGGEK